MKHQMQHNNHKNKAQPFLLLAAALLALSDCAVPTLSQVQQQKQSFLLKERAASIRPAGEEAEEVGCLECYRPRMNLLWLRIMLLYMMTPLRLNDF